MLIEISKNSKKYLPDKILGAEVFYEETANEYFEVVNLRQISDTNENSKEYSVLFGLRETPINSEFKLKAKLCFENGTEEFTEVPVKVVCYGKAALFHFLKSENAEIVNNENGTYSCKFAKSNEAVYINSIKHTQTENTVTFNPNDFGSNGLTDIHILCDGEKPKAGVVNRKAADAKAPEFFESDAAVIAWGDSITQSTVGNSYPSQLQANLCGQFKVINAGASGEAGIAIMSRNNLVPIAPNSSKKGAGVLRQDITFAAGQHLSEDIAEGDRFADLPRGMTVFATPDGTKINYTDIGNELKTENLIINGKSGYKLIMKDYITLGKENNEVYKWAKNAYFIAREDALKAEVLPKGSVLEFDYKNTDNAAHAAVVLFGANDGEKFHSEIIIERYKEFEKKTLNSIFIIPYFFQKDKSQDYIDAFGEKALEINSYFSKMAWDDYGVFPKYRDLERIEAGLLPYEFMAGDDASYKVENCHLNHLGYKILADLVYERGKKLGYWK